MSDLSIERIGGLGGFGLPGSRVRSHGSVAFDSLSQADQAAVEALFKSGGTGAAGMPDEFRYRIVRTTSAGSETVEAPASAVPAALQNSVKDELQ